MLVEGRRYAPLFLDASLTRKAMGMAKTDVEWGGDRVDSAVSRLARPLGIIHSVKPVIGGVNT